MLIDEVDPRVGLVLDGQGGLVLIDKIDVKSCLAVDGVVLRKVDEVNVELPGSRGGSSA